MAQLFLALAALAIALGGAQKPLNRIDRRALVDRHAPLLRQFDVESPLSVGNGRFAFTVDVTGLQTFPDAFASTIPLGTLSDWGWHTAPNPNQWSIGKYRFTEFESHGRKVPYADIPGDRKEEANWLRANPHRLHLGEIGFVLTHDDGRAATPSDLSAIEQRLDLWNGLIFSSFVFDGERVNVETFVNPRWDQIGVRVRSRLLGTPRLAIRIRFPYGTGATTAADWTKPEAHKTEMHGDGDGRAWFHRSLDGDGYQARATWTRGSIAAAAVPHTFVVRPVAAETFDFDILFQAQPTANGPLGPRTVESEVRRHWNTFWSTGGAIDLSGSSDPRWRELERRIVLSQYLTAVQSAGHNPPQETGLTFNSWEGKFHLEMHWWHGAHFALWDRLELLQPSLAFYSGIIDRARATAKRQGYRGARWPKMTSPSGAESPSSVGPFLVWQQPHPIFVAELAYRRRRDPAMLRRFELVVGETAEFMASYATWNAETSRYVLGPPMQCAQEEFPKDRTFNCSFELAYWRWGLETAQRWRTRLGRARNPLWDKVIAGLAPLPKEQGKYLFAENATGTYAGEKRWAKDHPTILAAFGLLPPGPAIDRETMGRTFEWIWEHWDWADTWGWDYPMVAMSAARLGRPDRAIDALLRDTPKNVYRKNGHNHQRPGLTIYLPGNGGLLYATAMMAAGWDGAPDRHAPGFPAAGWVVRWEGLRRAP